MKKRLASLVMALALCLTFLPATARADATTYNLWVGGERVTDANASNVLSNGKVSYDPTSTTLTLTDATISAGHPFSDPYLQCDKGGYAAIYSELPNLTIVVNGTCEASYTETGSDVCKAGIYCKAVGTTPANLTILGTGTLTAIGGRAEETTSENCYGIFTSGSLTSSVTNLNATANPAAVVRGIEARGPVTISEGIVNTTAGKSTTNASIGLETGGLLTVEGSGVLQAASLGAGTSTSSWSYGVACRKLAFVDGGTVTAEAGQTENSAAVSVGIDIGGESTITIGQLTATGGKPPLGVPSGNTTTAGISCGIRCQAKVTVSGGLVSATGDASSADKAYGVYCENGSMSITGGEVTASGATQAFGGSTEPTLGTCVKAAGGDDDTSLAAVTSPLVSGGYKVVKTTQWADAPVATPTFSPAAGEVTSGTAVTISTATDGATIYYTTDGSDPSSSSTLYDSTQKLTITAATTIKAIAVKEGMPDSEIASATYRLASSGDGSPLSGGSFSGGGGSSSSSSSTPATTTTTNNADGSTTTGTSSTTTTTNADGSVTEKTTESATTTTPTGEKTETESVVSVTTKENADGSTTETTTATENATMTDANGNLAGTVETKSETTETLDTDGNGTVEGKTTETIKDAGGKVTETTVTESRGTVRTDEDGTKTTTIVNTAVTTDAMTGKKTTVVTTEEKVETKDGTVADVVKDENGNVITAGANVSQKAVEEAQKTGEPVQIPMEITPTTPEKADGAAAVAITMPTPSTGSVAQMPRVEIEVPKSSLGVIAMIRDALGRLFPVKECYMGSVILPVDGSCEIVIVDNTKTFKDVPAGIWYADAVTFVTAREIFNGTGDGNFTPNAAMTRGMLAQVLYNFDRNASPKASSFADTAGKWYADAAGWANSAGVVTGTGSGFEGEANVTREQVAVMLYRYAKSIGADVSASADLGKFADADKVSDWALDAMRWAVGQGLINGIDGNLVPQGSATRAQLAAIMERFVEKAMK